ncbi:MAG: GFA family protein [Myxococcota bacterium]
MRIHLGVAIAVPCFEVEAPDDVEVEDCNCSICRMTGFLHSIVPASRFRLLAGERSLTTYRFNTGVARHRFCSVCGIKSFYVPRSNWMGSTRNLCCLDVPPETVRIVPFDGRAWSSTRTRSRTRAGRERKRPAPPVMKLAALEAGGRWSEAGRPRMLNASCGGFSASDRPAMRRSSHRLGTALLAHARWFPALGAVSRSKSQGPGHQRRDQWRTRARRQNTPWRACSL